MVVNKYVGVLKMFSGGRRHPPGQTAVVGVSTDHNLKWKRQFEIHLKHVYILLAFCIFSSFTIAQTHPAPAITGTITKVAKFKPPVVKTFLGRNSQTADVTKEEANQLINLPLRITDDKDNVYAISSYQFMYKKKSVIQNEETGKKETAFTTVADLFKSTPLPQVWKDNIGGGIQKDEELYFFDILVKDKLNRIFYAPDVKIRVQ